MKFCTIANPSMYFDRFCDLNDLPCIVYDHECIGESDTGDPMVAKDVIFTHWVENVHAVVEQLTEGPIVLVGCSTGGKSNNFFVFSNFVHIFFQFLHNFFKFCFFQKNPFFNKKLVKLC